MTKLINKVLIINKRRTSMRLCVSEWCALERICSEECLTRNKLIETIENNNPSGLGLTYMTRLFTLYYYYNTVTNPKLTIGTEKGNPKVLNLLKNLYSLKNAKE